MSQLTQASDPASTYVNRIQGRQILLENPVRQSKLKKQLEEKQQQRHTQKQKELAKEHGFWKFDESQIKYA
jgi:ribonuclease P protein subunit POP4